MELLARQRIAELLLDGSTVECITDANSHHLASCEGYQRSAVWVVRLSGARDASGAPNYLREIPALLQLAAACADSDDAFSIYPISTGNNWGYGSALAANGSAVILDLSKLCDIELDDEDLGLVTIGPGVTQQQLRDFLDARQLPFMVPVTGAGPYCSLLANALERGYGITPYTDHFAAVNALKAFLPSGERYQSSICELDKSAQHRIDKTFKWKVGPYLDGLFTQSGFGVVTEVTLRLKKLPPAFDSFYLQFAEDEDLEQAVLVARDILQRLEGVVGSVNIMDRRRVISMMVPNPNGSAAHQVMTDEQVKQLAKKHDVPGWTVIGTLYGEPAVVRAGRAVVNKLSAGKVKRRIYSNGWLVKLGKLAVSLIPGKLLEEPRNMLRSLDNGTAIMQGIPNQVALPLAFWRNPMQKADASRAMDPAIDGCGLLWYAPLVHFSPAAMRGLVEHVRRVAPQYGIEPMVTFTSLRHDTVDSTIPIVFNKHDAAVVQQATNCLATLVETGLTQGFVPYRLNLQQQQTLLDHNAVCWRMTKQLGDALDPKHVLAPGRYGK